MSDCREDAITLSPLISKTKNLPYFTSEVTRYTPEIIADAHPLFRIPDTICIQAFPKPSTTVSDLMDLPLPPIMTSYTRRLGLHWLSSENPNLISLEDIRSIPVPPTAVVWRHAQQAVDAAQRGVVSSVDCSHANKNANERAPLWILTFWLKVHDIYAGGLQQWKDAIRFLGQQRIRGQGKKKKEVISSVLDSFQRLLWDDAVHGFDRDCEPIAVIAQYASTEWMSSTHIQQMLELIQQSLGSHCDSVVADVWFTAMLHQFYQGREANIYASSKNGRFFRDLGEELASGKKKRVGGIANIDNSHWVAFVLDFETSELLYGDSLGGQPHMDVVAMLLWWANQHTGRQFMVNALPITYQSDHYSCGIMAYNSLGHALSPRTFPLISAQKALNERLNIMWRVISRHEQIKVSIHNLTEAQH